MTNTIKNLLPADPITITPNSDTSTVNIGMRALTSADVGLSSVNNTSDANKPISTFTQAALDKKAGLFYVQSPLTSAIDMNIHGSTLGQTVIGLDTTVLSNLLSNTINLSQSNFNAPNITIDSISQRAAGAGVLINSDAWVAAGKTLHADYIAGTASTNGVTFNDILTVGKATANQPIVVNGQSQASVFFNRRLSMD